MFYEAVELAGDELREPWLGVAASSTSVSSSSCTLLYSAVIPDSSQLFKHSLLSILSAPSLNRHQVIVRRAPEKICSGSADIKGIERIVIAIQERFR